MSLLDYLWWLFHGRKPVQPTPDGGDMLALHNVERQRRGVAALTIDARLTTAATGHAHWMATNNDLSHVGKNHSEPWDRAREVGYPVTAIGENVADGTALDTAGVWSLWYSSPAHLTNAVSQSFRNVGFASAVAKDGSVYWCALYGG